MAKRVLVVDDEDIIAKLIKDYLERSNYQVEIAMSGLDAVRKAKDFKPDIITLDIMMPGLNGFQVLTALKSEPSTKDIPVIVISITRTDATGQLFRLGAVDFFIKPIDFKRLIDQIEGIVEKKEKKVLVVDDDRAIIELFKNRLELQGINVIGTDDGDKAIKMAETEAPDLILIDLMLPKKDGYKIIRELVQNEKTSSIPVIIISAYITEDGKKYSLLGADKFLKKDITTDEFVGEIKNTIERKGIK